MVSQCLGIKLIDHGIFGTPRIVVAQAIKI